VNEKIDKLIDDLHWWRDKVDTKELKNLIDTIIGRVEDLKE
jgi:hypothetical protein